MHACGRTTEVNYNNAMRVRESRSGGVVRATFRQPRRSFSPAVRHSGGVGVQPGWQKTGGKGEIGLWCGLGSGKRRNRNIQDRTDQGFQTGIEERFQVIGRIDNRF
ncbi:hypothetical protein MtrunA17_Chr3g0111301 [Medicago truncatula]|uniref:Uncharacterized protein n=1 Tax=Medicago truncatula TaxID=3880 RepID=A0A396IRJ4_MEDTR|nr:hypothetical protein MtrunA17_Chr3g0111301 [Medicago truncatula]